jgi:beta-N-acetylhexosaminidase
VAATAKHFPGLGAAINDADSAPVTLDLDLATLRDVDEFPYHAAIRAGTELVMISNATYPALDPERPASLSSKVIEEELRGQLEFRGVTITDALEAGGLENFGSVSERGVLAAEAGADLLLFSAQNISEGINGSEALEVALENGTLDRTKDERSAERVLDLRGPLSTGEIGF